MILFTILLITLVVLAILAVLCVAVLGAAGIVVFGDVIVFQQSLMMDPSFILLKCRSNRPLITMSITDSREFQRL